MRLDESIPVSHVSVAHIVEYLFRRPVSELMGDAANSLNRFSPTDEEGSFLHRSIIFLRDGTDGVPNEVTPGSSLPSSFPVCQA
jgi:hypothetical protein